MKKIKFDKGSSADFSKTLRTRVNNYFKTNNKSIHGNRSMYLKTVVMLSVFIIPLIILGTGIVNSVPLLFALYITSGLGMAGVGMGVMHDAIHGSYSNNKLLNKILGNTMNIIGASASVWRVQHNVLHHTYTNIDEGDDDINAPFFLRFSPNAKHYWIHKYQHFYIWFFYGLSTISWITTKDFVRVTRYKNMGFFNKKGEYRKEVLKILGWKILYYFYALVLPLIMIDLPAYIIVLAFLSLHFVTGICISLVFQTAHIVSDATFPLPDEAGELDNDWTTHQLATTSNYAPSSRIFSWLIGGLNFQVEHHLFPNICHVHYRDLSLIVAETAEEYNVPYLVKQTFADALIDHVKMLKKLGQPQV